MSDNVRHFGLAVEEIIEYRNFNREWFFMPNHISLVASGLEDFKEMVKNVTPISKMVVAGDVADRFVAAAKLHNPIYLGDRLKRIEWLEIVQPTPEEMDNTISGLEDLDFHIPDFDYFSENDWPKLDEDVNSNSGIEYIEFYYPGIDELMEYFGGLNFEPELKSHPHREGLTAILQIDGVKFRFSDKPYDQIINEGIAAKKIRISKPDEHTFD